MKRSTLAWILIIVSVAVMMSGVIAVLIWDGLPGYAIWVPMVIGVLIMVIGLIASARDPDLTTDDNGIEIVGPMMDLVIPYGDVEWIEFRDKFDYGMRLMGFGGLSKIGGGFANKEFGGYKISGFANNPSFIVIHYKGGVVAFNRKTAEETRTTYHELVDVTEHVPKRHPTTKQKGVEQVVAEKRSTKMMTTMLLISIAIPVLALLYFGFVSDMYAVESMVYVMLIGSFCPIIFMGAYIMWERKKHIYTDNTMIMVGLTIFLTMLLGVAMPLMMFAFPNASGVDVDIDDDLEVHAPFMDRTVSFDDIYSIELRDDMDYGKRTNGYSGGDIRSGNFKNSEFGSYHLAAFKDVSSVIVVHHSSGTLVFNQSTIEETKSIYSELSLRV